jgi:hypothetical protein
VEVVTEMRNLCEKVEWNVEENSRAVLAAGRRKMGIKEEKKWWADLAGGMVKEGRRDDCRRVPLLWCGALLRVVGGRAAKGL